MNFNINGATWKIREVDEDVIKLEDEPDYTLGLTIYKKQEVLLNKNQKNILKTLKHELMHVWIYEYGHGQKDRFSCEDICEIVASSNSFINRIIIKYKDEMNN